MNSFSIKANQSFVVKVLNYVVTMRKNNHKIQHNDIIPLATNFIRFNRHYIIIISIYKFDSTKIK